MNDATPTAAGAPRRSPGLVVPRTTRAAPAPAAPAAPTTQQRTSVLRGGNHPPVTNVENTEVITRTGSDGPSLAVGALQRDLPRRNRGRNAPRLQAPQTPPVSRIDLRCAGRNLLDVLSKPRDRPRPADSAREHRRRQSPAPSPATARTLDSNATTDDSVALRTYRGGAGRRDRLPPPSSARDNPAARRSALRHALRSQPPISANPPKDHSPIVEFHLFTVATVQFRGVRRHPARELFVGPAPHVSYVERRSQQ